MCRCGSAPSGGWSWSEAESPAGNSGPTLGCCGRFAPGIPRDGAEAYAKFGGAPLTLTPVDYTWASSQGEVPLLIHKDDVIALPVNILSYFRKQKYNADYVLSAREGSDTLAYVALLEEKLLPAIIYKDAKECLNLLSNRLGRSQFFFGDMPTTLDAFVFGFLAPLYKARLLKVQLQEHLKQLPNLCDFCDHVLCVHFTEHTEGTSPAGQEAIDANLQKLTQLVNKESNLIEKMDDNLRRSPQNRPKTTTTLQPHASTEPRHPSQLLTP
ncbi:metaxin-3 isoform X3 [Engystomops pustulosus]|uniref:metaxin-3 isoform X3 n=1 Tax=Engystomops pustulosus TaxID=76066 RepID=UPI003AFA44F0